MDPIAQAYEDIAQSLASRIYGLIPSNPQILEIESAWDLFKVPDFNCKDLGPSWAQAQAALSIAQNRWNQEHPK